MTNNQQSSDDLKNLSEKRKALESLIRITSIIQEQQKSLLELSAASNASQDFPVSMMQHIKLLKGKIGDLPVADLLKKLEKIEEVTENNLEQIIQLVDVEPEQLGLYSNEKSESQFSVDEFEERIANFKRHTQTSIGLRLILKSRNVAIAPFRLPIPQAELNQHIRALKQKEKKCIKRVRKDIVEVIKDSVKIMQDDSISTQMRDCIEQIKGEMESNLEHLDNGGKIDKLPTKIEHHVLESEIELHVELLKIEEDESKNDEIPGLDSIDKPHAKENKTTTKPEKLSTWQVFKLWLISPWNVSWSSVKENQPTKSKK